MNENQCKDCQHFLQHYTLGTDSLFQVYCGHCTYSRARRKRPDSSACKNFAPGEHQENAFATKEYLSKKLLERLLSLELLPEIDGGG